jgi:alpha-D-xyloside xylohydrolase
MMMLRMIKQAVHARKLARWAVLVLVPLGPAPGAVGAEPGLGIQAVAVAPGVFRIALGEEPPTTGAAAAPQSFEIELGGLTLQVDGPAGQLAVVDKMATPGAAPRWHGAVRRLTRYGRAQVGGLELTWRAEADEALYGLGQRFNGLNQAGRRCAMWIVDAPGAGSEGDDSYYCTPHLFSSRGYAFLADDNPEGDFDLNSDGQGRHRYRRAGDHGQFYLVFADDLRALLLARVQLFGPPRDIPAWAWGPWISRNSFESQAEATAVIEEMIRRGWPVAAIVLEAWKGTSETGNFNAFSAARWPDLDAYFALCNRHGIRNVLWQVPILHPSAPGFADAAARGFFVKDPAGAPRLRTCWLPGFANVDFTEAQAVRFWQDQMRAAVRRGVAGFKADDGEDIHADDVFSDGRRGWQLHNAYPTLYGRALTELLDQEGIAGMLWARSGGLGSERTPALWAGDQYAEWAQLRRLVPAGLSASLSGMPFWGHDIGGYLGTPTPELYIRWLQFGAFSPLMQYHGMTPREPWCFGAQAEQAYDLLVRVRMALQPLLAALGEEAATTGLPIMRPMTLEFPDDPRFTAEDSQYMLGAEVLVAPVLHEGAVGRRVLFPAGTWRHLRQPLVFEGPGAYDVPLGGVEVPAFVRCGARLPLASTNGVDPWHWVPGAPTRRVAFDDEPALLRNLRVPVTANVIRGVAEITFEAADPLGSQLTVTGCPAGSEGAEEELPLERDGKRYRFTLRAGAGSKVMEQTQDFVIRRRNDRGEAEPFYRGRMRWQVPVEIAALTGDTLLRPGSTTTVKTRLRNHAADAVDAEVHACASTATVGPAGARPITIPGGGEQTVDWQVAFASEPTAASTKLRFDVRAGGWELTHTELVFAPQWRWIVVGPFAAPPRSAHRMAFGPEWAQTPDVTFPHPNEPETRRRWVQWRPASALSHAGVDLEACFGSCTHAAAYALTRLASTREQDAVLVLGSDDTITAWLNGVRILDKETYRLAVPDQERVTVRLQAGVNTLAIKVSQDVGPWRFYARIEGADGSMLSGVCDGFADYAAFGADRPAGTHAIETPTALPWQLAGPFPAGAEPVEAAALARAADPAANAALRWVAWRPAAGADGLIDLNAVLGRGAHAVAYAMTTLHAAAATPIELVCGSDDGLCLWLNGQALIDAPAPRAFRYDAHRVRATLEPGDNRLLARIGQDGGEWLLRVEVWDASQTPARPWGAAAE